MCRTLGIVVFVLAAGSNLYAQPVRGHIQGVGGMTFGTEPSQIFGGGFAVAINRHLQAIVDVGRLGDVVPPSIRSDINAGLDAISAETGVALRANVRAPALYWTTGIRVAAAPRGRLTPFAVLTAGSARISPELSVEANGMEFTPTDEALEEAGVNVGREPMVGVGGGVEIGVARRFAIELGYQFNRIFTEDPAVSTQRVYTGVNVKF